jgi:hypothetical protein
MRPGHPELPALLVSSTATARGVLPWPLLPTLRPALRRIRLLLVLAVATHRQLLCALRGARTVRRHRRLLRLVRRLASERRTLRRSVVTGLALRLGRLVLGHGSTFGAAPENPLKIRSELPKNSMKIR